MPKCLGEATVACTGRRVLSVLDAYVERCGLDPRLLALVQRRAAQIQGQRDQCGQRDAPYASERERAALLWTDELTHSDPQRAPDAVYEDVRRYFDPAELVKLTLAIITITAGHRLQGDGPA